MNLDNSSLFGIACLILLALLGGYLILLQIREHFSERPDPKLTYLPKTDFDNHIARLKSQMDNLATLTHANAEQIAALAAQTQIILQRISELATKLDRLQERANSTRSTRTLASRD